MINFVNGRYVDYQMILETSEGDEIGFLFAFKEEYPDDLVVAIHSLMENSVNKVGLDLPISMMMCPIINSRPICDLFDDNWVCPFHTYHD